MRKFNAILTIVIFVTFLAHGVLEAFKLFGVSNVQLNFIARAALVLVAVHTVIGCILTVQTLIACKRSGAPYFRYNRLFWARRISGFAIMVLLVFHLTAFGVGAKTRLNYFGTFELATQILLVLSIAVHVITNIKPVLISFGIKSLKPYSKDILFFSSIVLLFFIIAFIIFYVRFNVIV